MAQHSRHVLTEREPRRGIGATNRAVAGENDDGVGKALQDQRIRAAVLFLQGGAGGQAAGQTFDFAAERGHQDRGLGSDDRAGLVRVDAAHLVDQQIQVAPPDQGEDASGDDADGDACHCGPEVGPLRGGHDGEDSHRHPGEEGGDADQSQDRHPCCCAGEARSWEAHRCEMTGLGAGSKRDAPMALSSGSPTSNPLALARITMPAIR